LSSDSDDEDVPPYPISKIPYYLLKPPEIPNGRFVWNCPGCQHYIDFLTLTPDNLSPKILKDIEDIKEILLNKSWKIGDEAIKRLLFQMVDDHYREFHLPSDFKFDLPSDSVRASQSNK
jgi:hypothetical protein